VYSFYLYTVWGGTTDRLSPPYEIEEIEECTPSMRAGRGSLRAGRGSLGAGRGSFNFILLRWSLKIAIGG